jgi:hypothetical protein
MTIKRADVPAKFLTLELMETPDGEVGVLFTITSTEHGAVSIGFRESEADEAWRAMQRWTYAAETENRKRDEPT